MKGGAAPKPNAASRFQTGDNGAAAPPDGQVLRAVPVDQEREDAGTPRAPANPPARPPVCKVSGTVERGRKVMLKLDQEPGALLRVFGDRTDGAKFGEPYKVASPFVHQIIEAFAGVANGNLPEDMKGDFPADGVNAMLQAMSAFEPTNELEGMIAAQAVALHHVTLDSLARARRCDRMDFRQQHLGAANKSARTFAALVETLNRHRGKCSTQRVIVENVNVNAGGQAVVGAVAGVGSKGMGAVQPHANTERSASGAGGRAPRAALPGMDQDGRHLSASGGEGAQALPDARRRSGKRRAKGESEPAGARPLHIASNRDAPNGACAAAKRAGPDGLSAQATTQRGSADE